MDRKQGFKCQVGVVLGSSSDLKKVDRVFKVFDEFSIDYELAIISAHRAPKMLEEYARSISNRGIKIIIAAAGLSAALPGMLASLVTVPVIGIPINAGTIGGLDALFSISQMPPGVPVACVGIDSAQNAALLAVRMLSLTDLCLLEKLTKYQKRLSANTAQTNEKLKKEGYPIWDY